MTSKYKIKQPFLSALLLLALLAYSQVSKAKDVFIELTHSSGDDTFDGVSSVGLYGAFSKQFGMLSYGGVQITQFKDTTTSSDETVGRLFIGQALDGSISPFFEFGTDAYGLLILLLDNDDDETCRSDQKCTIDAYFRVGIRFNFTKELSLGIYHENISFGDSHTHLEGEHNYTGASLGFTF